jgi:hypothetical protein
MPNRKKEALDGISVSFQQNLFFSREQALNVSVNTLSMVIFLL